ncbi:hypothetical protein ACFQXB_17155 [Plastorhodobacter daqingensis]|uniref:Formate dehydrogenase n=1 Tax=Plastorhodobacter daqingensis TaxID=1387281 RepID=A0ABW2UNR8_9RHOB
MAKQDSTNRIGRRGFFGAALGAASAAALTAGGARPVVAQEVGDERTKARYQETEHVQAFYRTNRYYKQGE